MFRRERSATKLLAMKWASNLLVVWRLKADTSAKRATGTGGAKMLMGFEQESVGTAEAQLATRGTVPGLPRESNVEQHELTHLPFRSGRRHC